MGEKSTHLEDYALWDLNGPRAERAVSIFWAYTKEVAPSGQVEKSHLHLLGPPSSLEARMLDGVIELHRGDINSFYEVDFLLRLEAKGAKGNG